MVQGTVNLEVPITKKKEVPPLRHLSTVLRQCSPGPEQSWDSGLGTVVLGQWSWDSGLGTVVLDSGLGTVVLGQWSWDRGLGTVVLGQWSWDSGLGTVVLGH